MSATVTEIPPPTSDPIMDRIQLSNAPRMDPSDLDVAGHLTVDDVKTVEEFENEWTTFLKQYPHLFSTTQREEVLKQLATELSNMDKNYKTVQNELQLQLQFFDSSKERLESRFKEAIQASTSSQQQIHNDLRKHLDNIAVADMDIKMALPWEYFIETLDHAVDRDPKGVHIKGGASSAATTNAKTIRPSNRALMLVDRRPNFAKAVMQQGKSNKSVASSATDPNYNGPLLDINDPDVQLRAYRIDHTLLSTQVKMLQAELEMYDKHMESMDVIGKFLTEHNIWSLLNHHQSSTPAQAAASIAPAPTETTKPTSNTK